MAARSTTSSSFNHHRLSGVKDRQHGADPVPRVHDGNDLEASLESRLADFGSRRPNGSRAPISPPPLRRTPGGTPITFDPQHPALGKTCTASPAAAATVADAGRARASMSARRPSNSMSGPGTPHSSATPRHLTHSSPSMRTPRGSEDLDSNWTVFEVADQLEHFRQDIRDGHGRLTAYILESTKATERRIHHGKDLFAGVSAEPLKQKTDETMRIKLKQHLKTKKDQKEVHYVPVCTKTNKDRVPSYRFHHVGIKRNVLTPNTMLTFVPHLRDLETSEENKYNLWLKELEEIDLKSGFTPMNREGKLAHANQMERAATMSLYLETWLERLAIPGCNKSALISYMASTQPDDAITPQQKTDILKSHREADNTTPETNMAAQLFTDAFRLAFDERLPESKRIDLRTVLKLDESVDSIMESKPTAKDGAGTQNDDETADMDEDELADWNLATYCILGCLICFSHACDHGEYDNKNLKRTFSISSCSRLSDVLKRRRQRSAKARGGDGWKECAGHCYTSSLSPCNCDELREWTRNERILLRSVYATATHSAFDGDPICLAAAFLDRCCAQVHAEFKRLGISLPEPELPEPTRVKSLSWYDRHKKLLLGDWQDHTLSHEHQRRETLEPCSHEGPCRAGVCTCVEAGLLCEKFCGCSVETCEYKFTGCACHSLGKTCQQRQKEKPCICIQLNRECDPQLCGSCGALERADPANTHDERLHATGCQNCELQRGAAKTLALGQSQLEGVGYGLFTAEDIAQDDFIIEYVGELITHDEGVRREARRGDVFDEESNISYVFTLLENEGIWVDAAIYGNLSRYINHASEHDKRGCNITPRILYVNGEYRIKFTAMRDIQAGEELFFNYGENFPNLTKKLLDNKAGGEAGTGKAKGTKGRRAQAGDQVARKAPRPPKPEKKRRPGRPRSRKTETNDDTEAFGTPEPSGRSRKRKRQEHLDASEAEYRPRDPGAPRASDVGQVADSDEPDSMARLRKRARGYSGAQQPDTPTKAAELPKKPKGKRGGARPGSGRPRKHPRPVPKPVPAGEAVKIEEPGAAAAQAAAPAVVPQPRFEVIEISDSEDAVGPATNETPVGTHDAGDETMLDDEGDIDEDEDEDEDQDVVVRKRNDRAARNRRRPAKFRDDDIW
ncbi:putative enhancer of zeste 2 isoform a [Purpureocillium lavendulum]|uniref:Enhancer of zeste 2 isoform a n=1 Tax=Purpureocillium lavendulum TaxID=1247861 RepID=A0AB34FUC5_9HYPO|nr:putative enhancer of zeste 2 isoform a [Purpureocillium lavendulum]